MFLTAAELYELTARRQARKQQECLSANGIPWTVAPLSGRTLVDRDAYMERMGIPRARPPVDPAYAAGPWFKEGISIQAWKERNWERLYVSAVALFERRIPRDDVTTLESGIYFLYAIDGELLYIGRSVCIQNRVVDHVWARRISFTHVSWVEVPNYIVGGVEEAYIANLLPPCNVRSIPYGIFT